MEEEKEEVEPTLTRKDFVSDQEVRWCPGCGDYSVLANVQKVMPELGVPKENIVFVSGIGCSSRFPYYMNTFGFHTIHGRAPAFATGIKVSRPELSVWVITGDGDGLSIGGNHLLHAIRRNVNIQILLFNNRVYGLTKGQYSPTSRSGMKTKSSPQGAIDYPLDPVSFALGAGATFVARTIDVDANHLQEMLRRAHDHNGAAVIEIMQNCVVYNDGEWEKVENKSTRGDHSLQLYHRKPLVFGAGVSRRGIRIEDGTPKVVALAEDADPERERIVIHDDFSESVSYASALASMRAPAFPTPVGIFRQVERESYDDMMEHQVAQATSQRGTGNLRDLLESGDTWTVEA